MRRSDREITDTEEKLAILDKCKVCRLGLSVNNDLYIVPLNFGYTFANNALTLYFHSAQEGKKIDMLRANPHVCFELDTGHDLVHGDTACTYSFRYASLIGSGRVSFIDSREEKVYALNALMRHQTGQNRDLAFNDADLDQVLVYKLVVSEMSGKQH